MKTMVRELYDALRKAGVDEELSMDAARAVLPADVRIDLASKTDLLALRADFAELKASTRADIADLKVELIKWNVGAMAVLTASFAAIARLG